MNEELALYMMGQGLTPVKLNTDGIEVLYKADFDSVKAIIIYNLVKYSDFSVEKHIHIREQVVRMLSEKKGVSVNTVAILFTNFADNQRYILDDSSQEDERWIVDIENNTIIDRGELSSGFCDIRRYVEDVIKAESYKNAYIQKDKSVFVTPPTSREIRRKEMNTGRVHRRNGILRDYIFTMTTLLIVINAIIYFDLEATGNTLNPMFMLDYGAMHWSNVFDDGEWWRLFTSMFMHFGFDHLLGNMVVLFLLGNALEQAVGKMRFAIMYIGSGLTGALISCIYQWSVEGNVVSAGASGAIYGVMGAMIAVFGVCKIRTSVSLRGVVIYSIINIVNSMNTEGIDHLAHMGGFTSGALLAIILLLILPNDIIQERGRGRL